MEKTQNEKLLQYGRDRISASPLRQFLEQQKLNDIDRTLVSQRERQKLKLEKESVEKN